MNDLPKLGRQAVRQDARTLRLANYLTVRSPLSRLPSAPAACKYSDLVHDFRMYRNDEIGCCTIATAGHMIRAWSAEGRKEDVDIGDKAVLAAYAAISGYDPKKPETDQGAVELDVLRYWRKHGIGGHRIGAYVSVDLQPLGLLRAAIALFGGVYAGVALPLSAQNQDRWDVPAKGPIGPGEKGSWGGHAVPILDYDMSGLTVITWGKRKRMSWSFWAVYGEEAYAVLSEDFVKDGKAGSGFDVQTLRKDLALLKK